MFFLFIFIVRLVYLNLMSIDQISDNVDAVERSAALLRLSDEFCETAQRIGRIIIDELSLPNSKKTYKPRDMGGVAGGQKYLEGGVFFKFARDAFGLYGGDEFSMKAGKNRDFF